jgi:hypothetical protein
MRVVFENLGRRLVRVRLDDRIEHDIVFRVQNAFRGYALGLANMLPYQQTPSYGWLSEVDPDFGTGGLIGNSAAPLLNGADHDETNETKD